MARGVYTFNYRIAAVTAAKTLFYITVATGRMVELRYTEVTDEDNDTNEQTPMCWQKITTLGTPTATALTAPTEHEEGDGGEGSTYFANVTASEPTYGAIAAGAALVDVYGFKAFPLLTGYLHAPTDQADYLYMASGTSWGLRHLTTITSSQLALNIVVREVG